MNESEFKKVIIVKARRAGYSHIISEMMKNDPFFDVTYIKKKIFGIDKPDERIRTINKILKNG